MRLKREYDHFVWRLKVWVCSMQGHSWLAHSTGRQTCSNCGAIRQRRYPSEQSRWLDVYDGNPNEDPKL